MDNFEYESDINPYQGKELLKGIVYNIVFFSFLIGGCFYLSYKDEMRWDVFVKNNDCQYTQPFANSKQKVFACNDGKVYLK